MSDNYSGQPDTYVPPPLPPTEDEVENDYDLTADVLREQVEIRKGPDDGTVIIFEYAFDLEPKPKKRKYYTYVAVFLEATGLWYITGQGTPRGIQRDTDNDSLMKVLASNNVKSAMVATEFTQFKP